VRTHRVDVPFFEQALSSPVACRRTDIHQYRQFRIAEPFIILQVIQNAPIGAINF